MRIFNENQRFTQLWLLVLLTMSSVVPLIIITQAFWNNEMSVQSYLITLSLIVFSFLFIFVFKLTTRIDEIGIHYKFFPFHLKPKTIPWKAMSEVYTRKYDALNEYGGWGCKGGKLWKKENGIAYNVSGEEGIQIITTEGKKILIGTQEINKAQATITYYRKTLTHD